MTSTERRTLLALLGFLSFAAVYAQVAVAPMLTSIAQEFDVSTGTAGLAVAAYGVPGIILTVVAGPYSDRFGRKPFLVVGSFLLGLLTFASALAPSFLLLLLLRAGAGAGSSLIFPNMHATMGDSFPYRERGRAVSIVIALNTMGSVAGVPISGILAEAISWRASLALTGVVVFASTLVLARRLRPDRPGGDQAKARALFATIFASRSALAALGSSFLITLLWIIWSTYIVVFLQHTYGLSAGLASVIALTSGVGVLIGSLIGGRLGDRGGNRRVIYRVTPLTAGLLLFLTIVPVPLPLAAAIILVMAGFMGMRFATNSTLLTEQVPGARGTMLAVHSSIQSVALVVGAAVGGLLIDGSGFAALGLFSATSALLGALATFLFVKERPAEGATA